MLCKDLITQLSTWYALPEKDPCLLLASAGQEGERFWNFCDQAENVLTAKGAGRARGVEGGRWEVGNTVRILFENPGHALYI